MDMLWVVSKQEGTMKCITAIIILMLLMFAAVPALGQSSTCGCRLLFNQLNPSVERPSGRSGIISHRLCVAESFCGQTLSGGAVLH